MINFYKSLRISCSILCLLLSINTIYAQVGRLPTKQELDVKANLQQLYNTNGLSKSTPTHLLTTGPEQNCANAIPVCQQSYTQSNSYTGSGSLQELSSTCLSTNETNSVWYVFTVQNSGTFTFLLNTPNDYDFALYDITSIGCAGVPSATPIRCNFSATYGSTGLTLPSSAGNISVPASGSPTMPGINVSAGQTFALIIDNFSANTNGYTLTFGGTAQIFDNTPPTLTTLNIPCNSSYFNLNFSEPVLCSSIATNGSDFIITGPSGNVPVTSASGNLCSSGASTSNYATVNFNNTGLVTGTYTVSVVNGSDGNTMLDKCGNVMSTSQVATFQYLGVLSISATNTIICAGSPSTLSVSITGGAPTGVSYNWSPVVGSSSSITVNPNITNTYLATVTYGGCSSSISQVITVDLPPVVNVTPANISLCSGTSNIIASAMMGGSPCASCNYTWSGSSTQVNNSVPSSTITGAGPGSYSVTVSSNTGCLGNTAVSNVSIISPASLPSCNIIYASPTNTTGTGLIPSSPTSIQNALTLAACNNVVIKMQIGDYIINNPLNISSFVTIEGGYDVGFTTKTSAKGTSGGFSVQGTRIIRSTANLEGSIGNLRYTALNINPSSSYFRIQDLRIEMPDNAAGTGISNYAIYLGLGCSDYNITRCYIYSGNAGSGVSGNPGANGSIGSNGFYGGSGGNGNTSGAHTLGTGLGDAGFGGAGAGAGAGVGGAGWFYYGGATGCCDPGLNSTNPRSGGGGGGAGTGGYYNRNGVNGGIGGNGGTGGTGAGITGVGGLYDCGWYSYMDGTVGKNGVAGNAGSVGTIGAVGSDASGYWILGGIGTDGSGFLCFNSNGTGGGGGGGGGGGEGGAGGTGGSSGGSTFGVFIFNNGANGNIVDCQIVTGSPGAGGIGGAGGTGGNGGIGGAGGCADACTGSGEGNGAAGGTGGKGGNGGKGGDGSPGIANAVRLVGGSALVSNISTFTLTTQPIITVENKACTNTTIAHTSTLTTPSWSSYGTGASPASGSGSPTSTSYSSIGRKTVTLNASNYTDFNNIIVNPPATGNIIASATSICPGSANFASSVVGTAGLNYTWSVAPATATISSATTGSTSIVFANSGTTPITYTITLSMNSNCCGNLNPITQIITVNPTPATPAAASSSACVGGVVTYTANSPAGSNFGWYTTAGATTLLASGTTYSIANVVVPTTIYLQATNSAGCTSSVIPVAVTPTAVPPPTVIPGSACDIGLVQVGVNPVAGATGYNWYSDAAGTTLVQSGTILNYSQVVGTTGGSYTIYVQTDIAGCNPSAIVAVSGSVSNTPITLSNTITPNDTICINAPVTFSLNPGGGNGTYTYTWSPFTSNSNTATQSFSASTSVNVMISSNGCTKQFLLPIIITPYPKDTIAPHLDITCATSSLTLDGSNSSTGSTYTYSWTTTGGNILTSTTLSSINVDAAGTYTLTVNDLVTGCSSIMSATVILNNVPPLIAITSPSVVTCLTPTTSLISTTTSTSTTLSYSWTTTTGNIASGSNSNTATTGTAGIYTLTVIDAASSCTSIAMTTVTGNSTPPVFTTTISNIPCGSTTTTLAAACTNTDVTYVWTGPAVTSIISGSSTATPTIGDVGSYTVIATDAVSGCTNTASGAVAQGTINAAFSANPTTGIAPLLVTFTDLSTGAASYNWTFGDGSAVSTSTNPTNTYTTNGTYTVTLLITSGTCVDTATAIIIVENGLTLEIPNVFTPNGDGINDLFTILSTGVKEIDLQIFNRWGQKLFSFNGPKAAWDGLTDKGAKVPDGTYFFFVKATGFDDKTIEKQGTVNLFR
jgi:gliding motility-associated-like protein